MRGKRKDFFLTALEEIVQSEEPSQMHRPEGVKKITVVNDTVDFSCGRTGTGDDKVYYGNFYYYEAHF